MYTGFLFGVIENVLELDGGNGYTTPNIIIKDSTYLHTLKGKILWVCELLSIKLLLKNIISSPTDYFF